jgi:membrane protein
MKVVKALYRKWCQHHGGALSSELALFSLLSMLPLLLTLTALLGYARSIVGVEATVELQNWVITQVTRVIGERPEILTVIEDLFETSASSTLTVGVIVTLYAASRVFSSMVGSLDTVFECQQHRTWIGQRIAGMVLAVISMLLLPVVVVATTASHVVATGWMNRVVGAGGYGIAVLWIAALYHWVPKHTTTLRAQIPGAAAVVAMIAALTAMFRWYLVLFDENAVFGVIGTGVSLLWYGYFACSAFFIGAEINAHLTARNKNSEPEPG